MDGKMLARLGAIAFITVAITATVIELTRKEDDPATTLVRLPQSDGTPLREDQRRCQRLGQQAASDPDCLSVWRRTRDSFLGREPGPASSSNRGGR